MFNKVRPPDSSERYGFDGNNEINFHKIWMIMDPNLRHIRLKIAWKDVMSLERCNRYRMTDNPNCNICGQLETVEHQLWQCSNAQKIWRRVSLCCGHRGARRAGRGLLCWAGLRQPRWNGCIIRPAHQARDLHADERSVGF